MKRWVPGKTGYLWYHECGRRLVHARGGDKEFEGGYRGESSVFAELRFKRCKCGARNPRPSDRLKKV